MEINQNETITMKYDKRAWGSESNLTSAFTVLLWIWFKTHNLIQKCTKEGKKYKFEKYFLKI